MGSLNSGVDKCFLSPGQTFALRWKFTRRKRKVCYLPLVRLEKELFLKWIFFQGLMESPCLLEFFPQSSSNQIIVHFFLSQEIKWIICLSYRCFYSCLFSGILNFLILGRPLMREGLSRRTFPVFLFVCVCVCMHIQYLSTDSWKQKKIGLLNFPFDLCLPVCPLLLWLKFWLTRKILYSWVIDKWLSRDIDAFSFTGMPRFPVQDQVPSY